MSKEQLIDDAAKSISQINELLPTLKTAGEKVEALEKQLADTTRMVTELKAERRTQYGDDLGRNPFQEIKAEYPVHRNKMMLNRILTSPSQSAEIQELHTIADTWKILRGVQPKLKAEDFRYYNDVLLPFCEKSSFGKALIDAGSSPTQWAPEGWSPEVRTYYMDALGFTSAFPRVQMERSIEQYPFAGTGFRVDARTEQTSLPPAAADTSEPTRDGFTLSTVELAGILPYTEIFDEDTLRRYVPQLRERVIPRGMAEAEDDMIINGDTASPHQDGTYAANDRRRQKLGVRAEAVDESGTYDTQTATAPNTAAFEYDDTVETLAQHNNGLGTRPDEGAWVFSHKAYLKMGKFDEIKTNAQLANTLPSIVESGAINLLHGRPVFVSSNYPEDMNSSGIVASGSTLTGFSHVNVMQYVIGEFRSERIQTHEDPLSGVNYIIISSRIEFKKLLPTGNVSAVSGVNIAT